MAKIRKRGRDPKRRDGSQGQIAGYLKVLIINGRRRAILGHDSFKGWLMEKIEGHERHVLFVNVLRLLRNYPNDKKAILNHKIRRYLHSHGKDELDVLRADLLDLFRDLESSLPTRAEK